MRETSRWKRELAKRLVDEGNLSQDHASRLCDVELGLALVEDLLPGEAAEVIPALLSGHEFLLPRTECWNADQWQMLAVGRYLLRYFQGTRTWPEALWWYASVPDRVRLYEADNCGVVLARRAPSVCSDRREIYLKTLRTPPLHTESREAYAANDRPYYFLHDGAWDSVRFPQRLIDRMPSVSDRSLRAKTSREPLRVRWSELLATANWMDAQEPSGRQTWRSRMERVRLRLLDNGDDDGVAEDLTLDGLFHLVGMVSSGKSTLMDVLAVWTARNGLRATLVVGDIVDAVSRATMFCRFGVTAVPLLGATNRARHMERLRRVISADEAEESPLSQDARLRWVSPICLLDGLRQSDSVLELGDEPCDELYPEPNEAKTPVRCPLMPACPVHRSSNELIEASIWVATPASLLYTRAPLQATSKRMRLLELAYRESDLIIVDEADRVQVQLDDAFGPSDSLIGTTGNGWLDRLARMSVPAQGRARGEYLTAETHGWVEAQRVAQQAADLMVTLMVQHPHLQDWVTTRDYFTGLSLLLQLREEIRNGQMDEPLDAPAMNEFNDQLREFLDDPLGQESDLSEIARQAVLVANSARARGLAENWLLAAVGSSGVDGPALARLQDKLVLAAAAAVLDDRLKTIVDRWDVAESAFSLDAGSEWFFRRPPRDYGPLIPEAPMGNLFGFRYASSPDGRHGDLQFFRCAGVGRWVLLHLHDLFERVDGIKGPHALLLSGTSWAPGSSSYHLQVPPMGVLEAPEEEVAAIHQSSCTFEPAYTEDMLPVRVSGTSGDERMRGLKRELDALAVGRGPDGKTHLLRELEGLPEDRRRLLLVVGSYRETEQVVGHLRSVPGWEDKVVGMVPDDDVARSESGSTLPRGLVYRFPERSESVLVAPLLAIERGHNLLTEDGRAAVGSVYFLVRPMPVPFALGSALQHMNWWALDQHSLAVPLRDGPIQLTTQWKEFRRRAVAQWHRVLGQPGYYSVLEEAERRGLAWSQLVCLWQTVGRAVRGGSPVRVHFCDAAFAPHAADKKGKDTVRTSLLLAIREALGEYITSPALPDGVPAAERKVANLLYAPWAAALGHIEGID